MNRISLNVLDEYAMRLSRKQIKMLQESKKGVTNKYTKILNEAMPVNDGKRFITLDKTDIEYQTGKDANDFVATLDYEHPELENITCSIRPETIEFCYDSTDKQALIDALYSYDIDVENLNIR